MLKESIWQMEKTDEDKVASIMSYGKVPYTIACLLVHRGVDTPEAFDSYYHVTRDRFHDPFLMLDMDVAVKRILDARDKGEQVYIYGDYDVDGVTSTSVLYMYLDELGCKVDFYIPDRHEEGYGINAEAVSKLKELGADVMVSVDTGITAVDQVDHANELGIDVIITDHHECQEVIPRALAVINPKRPDNPYPFKLLAGVGVTFKLIHALAIKTSTEHLIWKYLDIVAVGTVADIVPLHGENRIITKLAFETMPTTWNPGLKALMRVTEMEGKKMTAGRIGFGIGPRLNAAGRIKHAKEAVELFVSHDEQRCMTIAEELDEVNKERQALERKIFEEAVDIIETTMDPEGQHVIVVASDGWHHGVIGIVASRLVEKYYRPVIILAIEDGIASGSARSVEGFSIYDALYANKEVFDKFGGHEMAAGMSLKAGLIEQLRTGLNTYAQAHMAEDTLIPKLKVDMSLDAQQVSIPFIEELQNMEPFGIGNREPSFEIRSQVSEVKKIGKDMSHLRIGFGKNLNGIGFSMAEASDWLDEGQTARVVCTLDINEWRQQRNPQMMLRDIRLDQEVYDSLSEMVAMLSSDRLDELVAGNKVSREDCTKVYRYLQQQAMIKVEKVSYTGFAHASGLTAIKDLGPSLVVLEIFRELELLEVTYNPFDFTFILNKGKKVDLASSKLYNRYGLS